MRAISLILLPGLASAAPWKSERRTETRLQQLHLISKDPAFERREPVATLGGRYRLLGEGISTQWTHELGLDLGKSMKTRANYQVASARSSVAFLRPYSTSSLSLGLLHSRGNDPINQPVEIVVTDPDPAAYTSLQFAYTYQYSFNVRHSLGIELGLSQNQQADFRLETEDLQLAYTYNSSRLSTTKWRIRLSEQQGDDIADNHQREIAMDQLLAFSQTLSADASLGYNIRQQGDQKGQGVLYLAAINYSSQDELSEDDEQPTRMPKPKEQVDLKSNKGLKGASLLRLGWSRNRDQRRIGDPIFVADQIFFVWGLSLNQNHGLQLSLRSTEAQEPLPTPDAAFGEDSVDLSYRWNHVWGSGRQAVGGVWGLEASAQETEADGRAYQRQVYTMSYGLTF